MPDFSLLETMLAANGYPLFFLLTVAEGPIATLTAAVLAQKGAMDLRLVFALAVLGDVLGDVLFYLLGRFGVGLLPGRMRHRLGLDHHLLRPMARAFGHSGGRLILLGKLTHVAGLPTLVAAGMGRMALLPFVLFTLLATVIKVGVLCALGWVLGDVAAKLAGLGWWPVTGAVGLALAGFALIHHQFRKQDRRCA